MYAECVQLVCLFVLAAVVWSWDTSCTLSAYSSVACLPVCVGCGRVELGHELYAECVQLVCLFAWLCWLRSCGAGTRAVRCTKFTV